MKACTARSRGLFHGPLVTLKTETITLSSQAASFEDRLCSSWIIFAQEHKKYSEQAGCKFSLTLALMADVLNYNHQVCRWSVVRGACLHLRAGCDTALPQWVTLQESCTHPYCENWLDAFIRKITFHQEIAFHQNVPVWAKSLFFVGEAHFWECCCFAGIFLREGFFISQQ